MKRIAYMLILSAAWSMSVNAEVFKCKQASGKVIYQPTPCAANQATQGVINVKQMTPEESEAANAKLRAWKEQQSTEDAQKRVVEKERQLELERQESLELQRRSVVAQEQALAEQQRQQQQQYNQPLYVPGYGGRYWNNPYNSPYGSRHPNQQPYPGNRPGHWNKSGYGSPYDGLRYEDLPRMLPPTPGQSYQNQNPSLPLKPPTHPVEPMMRPYQR